MATLAGATPLTWPVGFEPSLLPQTGGPIGPWEVSYPVTKDGKIIAVDIPGHVPGHISLIIFDEDVTYLLGDDAAYSLSLLDEEKIDVINNDQEVALDTMKKIKLFCKERGNVVLLPSHEFASRQRLTKKTFYHPS